MSVKFFVQYTSTPTAPATSPATHRSVSLSNICLRQTGNILNLPDKVFFPDGSRIDISYDGDGNVLRKFITSTTDTLPNDEMTMQVDYVAGFMYVDGEFQSFSHPLALWNSPAAPRGSAHVGWQLI